MHLHGYVRDTEEVIQTGHINLGETMKKLGFDTSAIISFLVKYKIGSIQNLVTAFWFVEDVCTGSSLIEVVNSNENRLNTQCRRLI